MSSTNSDTTGHQNTRTREEIIVRTSILGVVVNILIAAIKIGVGITVSSIAIVTEGVNSVTDALSSIMTFAGTKLAHKHADEKHPFGYGRIEYITSLVISGMILFAGIEMIIGSVKNIIHPETMSVSFVSIIIVAVAATIKLILGLYTINKGKEAESSALVAIGKECRNDVIASCITIASSLIFIFFRFSLDAYAGIIIAIMIVKTGFESLRETLDDLIGRPGDIKLADKIYSEIRNTDGVVAAADIMLHNYGPEAWSGSVNLEIDHEKTVGEIYGYLHELQLRIMHEYHVTMVFGVYAVDNDSENIRELRESIASFVRDHEHAKSYHAVYLDSKNKAIYCDIVVKYSLKDWNSFRIELEEYLGSRYPGYRIEPTIETEYIRY